MHGWARGDGRHTEKETWSTERGVSEQWMSGRSDGDAPNAGASTHSARSAGMVKMTLTGRMSTPSDMGKPSYAETAM